MTHMERPEPKFLPTEPVQIAYCENVSLIGLQATVQEIKFRTWFCAAAPGAANQEPFMWSGWGCRLDVGVEGITWFAEDCLKKLPRNGPGQWIEEYKPSLLEVPA